MLTRPETIVQTRDLAPPSTSPSSSATVAALEVIAPPSIPYNDVVFRYLSHSAFNEQQESQKHSTRPTLKQLRSQTLKHLPRERKRRFRIYIRNEGSAMELGLSRTLPITSCASQRGSAISSAIASAIAVVPTGKFGGYGSTWSSLSSKVLQCS